MGITTKDPLYSTLGPDPAGLWTKIGTVLLPEFQGPDRANAPGAIFIDHITPFYTRGRATFFGAAGAVAQLEERLNGIQEVGGSIPLGSTSLRRGFSWQGGAGRMGRITR